MDAMITKHLVEAFTEGLALTIAFAIFGFFFFGILDKRARYLARKARKAKK
jgi:hypothetical protein